MSWLELLSPNLRGALDSWCHFRGPRKVPHTDFFAEFCKTVAIDFLAVVSVSEKRLCKFVSIGPNIAPLYPGCVPGMTFANISPVTTRLLISKPINEVITSRQPSSRRSTYRLQDGDSFYEQAFLPFVDKNFEVRLMAIVSDGYVLKREVA